MYKYLIKNMNIFKLYTDGSHMPNANVSGIGGYLLDHNDKQIFEFSEIINDGRDLTKFEIHAMEHGLKMALSHGVKSLEVLSDDKSLCDISNIKDAKLLAYYIEHNPHLTKILTLVLEFDHITFTHLPRVLNKKADALSRKAILAKIPTGHVPLENSFQTESLLFSEKLSPDDKKVFANYKKKYTDFYFFDMKQEKIEGQQQFNYAIQAWFSKKTQKGIENTLIGEIQLNDKNMRSEILQFITKTLDSSMLENIGLVIYGKNSAPLREILKGLTPIPEKNKDDLEALRTTLGQFKEVVFYDDSALINSFYPGAIKDVEKKTLSKEELISAMKILGENEYQIGHNSQIETYYDLPDFKKNNISEIQKKYFMEFLKISFRDEYLFKTYTHVQAEKSSGNNPDILLKIQQIREELQNKGVKLRY